MSGDQSHAPLAHCPKCFKTTVVDRSESGWKLCTTCSHTWQPPRESAPSGERLLDQLLRDLTAHDGPKVTTVVSVASWAYDELTRLGRLDAAEVAIRGLHVEHYDGYIGQTICSHCSDEDRWAIWPCRTIAVMEEALRGE